MLQVLNLRRLLEALAAELTERLQTSTLAPGEVNLRVREETVGLVWDGKSVSVGASKEGWVELGQDGMMKMVLGLVPVEQVVKGEGKDMAMLRAAFPIQGTATGVWG